MDFLSQYVVASQADWVTENGKTKAIFLSLLSLWRV